jgi:purine nucleosidase
MGNSAVNEQRKYKVHLDTDFGGDIDDFCALALLLRWPEPIQLTGITTVAENGGRRAGYVRYVLMMEGREDIPLAAGADNAQGYYPYELGLPPEENYWPEAVTPFSTPLEEALELLKRSIDQGATIVGIGPYTNLYLLDLRYPGILRRANLVLMGGYVFPVRPGYPQWGNDMDFNIQIDARSALHVLQNSSPTLVPLSMTVETALRRAYLPGLRTAGALGNLLADQAEAFAVEYQNEKNLGETCAGLPDDLINFQHDPLACAVALGWTEGMEIQELPLTFQVENGLLVERVDPTGKPVRVVTSIDGAGFSEFWLECIQGRTA